MRRPSTPVLIAFAAGLAHAPRMLVLFVEADGTAMPTAFHGACLAVSAIGFVAALSFGNAHLAQAVFRCRRWGLTVAWAVTLLLETLLLGPSIAAGLEGKDLAGVLGSPALRWAWSLGVVLALAGIVALAMIAEQLAHEPRHRCPYCDWRGDSQPALAGHLRACPGRRGLEGLAP